ncbi:MAG: pre-peptidase C-terminal domain-containing protein [Chloroflexi bacterium]|nr:pre-peptidase C-terminal domain-containing protein [Chloroflexota bacterium]
MSLQKIGMLVLSSLIIIAVALVVFTPKEASAATVTYHDSLLWETGNTNNGYDEYALDIEAGQTVQLVMLCNAADFNPLIQIYQDGTLVASDDNSYPAGSENPCGNSALLNFTAPAAGGYVVRATTYDFVNGVDAGHGVGGYSLAANGTFLSLGPTANNVPHLGLVLIGWGQSQPAFVAAASSQVMTGSDGAEIRLPADADGSGYDTYIVTGAVNMNGVTWISIWLGGSAYGWVPLKNVTPVTTLDIPNFATSTARPRASATHVPTTVAPTQVPSATVTQ